MMICVKAEMDELVDWRQAEAPKAQGLGNDVPWEWYLEDLLHEAMAR